jgi:(p)ppGpp synthase/HD superfamily hydrolase
MKLTARFDDALGYAARLHARQVRKGTDIPYISHLLGVCSIVLEYGGDEDQAIAALLHDGPEDQGGQAALDDIRTRFGAAVADIVAGCTDTLVMPKPPWQARKEAYIAHLADMPAPVRLVSAADKLYNAQAILRDYYRLGDGLWDRFTGGKAGTLWYYRELANVFHALGPHSLAEELERVVTELEQLVTAG